MVPLLIFAVPNKKGLVLIQKASERGSKKPSQIFDEIGENKALLVKKSLLSLPSEILQGRSSLGVK